MAALGAPLVRAPHHGPAHLRPGGDGTKAFPSYPYGTEIELLPHGAKIPGVDEVVATNKAIYDKFELGYPRPGTDDEFATAIHQRYAATWKTLARKLAAEGKNEQAEWAIGVARELGPQAD